MNVNTHQRGLPEPWTIHKDTLESLDPIFKKIAESYIRMGIWLLKD
jgi:hypothetical protein